jgi:prepilin-type N-terminal cleavage/methylation domain-containing protein
MHKRLIGDPGFTLVEVLVVIAITLILTVVSITGLREFSNRSGHKSAAHTILGALEEAHARTLSSDGDTTYGVHFETDMVVVFEGTSYTAGDPDNDERSLPARTNVTNISLGGGSEVYFERLSGDVSPTGTVTVSLTHSSSTSKTVTIYSSGLSEIN